MAPMLRKRITIYNWPDALQHKLVDDLNARDARSLTELVSLILAERYGIPAPEGRRRRSDIPAKTGERIILKIEQTLYERVRQRAFETHNTLAGEVVVSLCDHYGLPAPSPNGR
jgi:hypothetical protein